VLEAMCAARPVVATRVGGIPEVVVDGDTGLLVAPRHPERLAEAIARLLDAPDETQLMGLRGRQRVEQVYSLARMCRAVERIYDSLLLPATRGLPAARGAELRASG
jgi:glycosyltransferase involved in cell wall biosynthesis